MTAARIALPDSLLTSPIAHRGYHNRAEGRIENSRAAVRAAITAGYGIEIDLQLSSDGVAMVFHDDTLDRLTAESGRVRDRTAAELGQITLKDSQETIPTLADILSIVAGQAPLLIEIKDQDGNLGPQVGALEAAAAEALRAYRGDYAVMSFNPHAVAALAEHLPHVARGLTTCDYTPEDWQEEAPQANLAQLRAIPDYDRTGASFLSHYARDLDRPRVQELKAQGARLLCWTIRSEAEATAALALGAENITFENYPA